LLGRQMAELAPPQLLAGALGSLVGFVFPGEQGAEFLLQEFRLAPLQLVQCVEPPHEEQIADLLDRGERIGDPAGPELVPELVNIGANRWCQHPVTLTTVPGPTWPRGHD